MLHGLSGGFVSHCGPWDIAERLCYGNQDVNMNVQPLRRAIISSVCYGEENQYGHHKRLEKSQQLSCVQGTKHGSGVFFI